MGNPYIEENGQGTAKGGGLLRFDVAAGAASASLISVGAMRAEDEIISVLKFDSGVPSDVTADVTAVAASGFKLSVVTSSKQLWVAWLDRTIKR